MTANVHPTAIVGSQVVLGDGVEIGPYCVVEGEIRIGARTRLSNHVSIKGNTVIGADNQFFPFASIGEVSQDATPSEARTLLEIGNHNTFRECTTINAGSRDQCRTLIGDHNLFMACTHVAHDCQIGNHVILANNTVMAGHVQVYDNATVGGACAIHQFSRIGQYSMIGGFSRVSRDVPPFVLANGVPLHAAHINRIGLKRADFSSERINKILELFRIYFSGGHNMKTRLARLAEIAKDGEDERLFYDFVSEPDKRAIVRRPE